MAWLGLKSTRKIICQLLTHCKATRLLTTQVRFYWFVHWYVVALLHILMLLLLLVFYVHVVVVVDVVVVVFMFMLLLLLLLMSKPQLNHNSTQPQPNITLVG